eukprot:gene33670-40733_t
MLTGPARRTTLGPLNPSMLNTRRNSLENGALPSKPPRPSMGAAGAIAVQPSQAARRSSLSGSGGRLSDRRSSSLPSSTGVPPRDPRNLSDKNALPHGVRALYEFLHTHQFFSHNPSMSLKSLYRPTNKEFYSIVLFLFKMLDGNYVCVGKMEDEIITMFKFLGYPYALSKSSLSAVGSPHAWPQVLAALLWLTELLNYDQAVVASSSAQNNNVARLTDAPAVEGGEMILTSSQQLEKKFYAYLHSAYHLFIAHKDSAYLHAEETFHADMSNGLLALQEAQQSYLSRISVLDTEIRFIKERSLKIPYLSQRRAEGLASVLRIKEFLVGLRRETSDWAERASKIAADVEGLRGALGDCSKDIHKCKDILSRQEISAADVQNMQTERQRLENQYQLASEHRQQVCKDILKSELQLKDTLHYLEQSVLRYHAVCEELKLVPLSNKNARGQDYCIIIDTKAKRRDSLLRTDVKGHTLLLLNMCREELREATLLLRQTLIQEMELSEELEIERTKQSELETSFLDKIAFMEDVYEKEKHNFDSAYTFFQKEIYAHNNKLVSLRDISVLEHEMTSLQRRIFELTSQKQNMKTEYLNKIQNYMEDIFHVVNACASYREEVTSKLDDLKVVYAGVLGRVLEGQGVRVARE